VSFFRLSVEEEFLGKELAFDVYLHRGCSLPFAGSPPDWVDSERSPGTFPPSAFFPPLDIRGF